MSGLTNVELLGGGGAFGLGTRWRETRTMFGKEATEEMEITAYVAPVSYRAEAESHGAHYVSDLTFDDLGDGATAVTMTFDGRPTTVVGKLMAPMWWLFRGATRKMIQRDLDDMKAALEGDVSAT